MLLFGADGSMTRVVKVIFAGTVAVASTCSGATAFPTASQSHPLSNSDHDVDQCLSRYYL
jgi:hypothetical protein